MLSRNQNGDMRAWSIAWEKDGLDKGVETPEDPGKRLEQGEGWENPGSGLDSLKESLFVPENQENM